MQFKELEPLFESDTIKPTFTYAHIFLSLIIFDQNPNGIGRYRLKEELLVGSGTARSLIEKLKGKTKFIEVMRENGKKSNKRSGHILTKKGRSFLNEFKKKIPFLVSGDLKILEDLIIESKNVQASICLVKKAANKMKYGVEQRDAAIMMGGSGATCLQFDGNALTFPTISQNHKIDNDHISKKVEDYLKKLVTDNASLLETGDIIIIGLGENNKKARLAALNSALTLI